MAVGVGKIMDRYVLQLRSLKLKDLETLISTIEKYKKEENREGITLYSR